MRRASSIVTAVIVCAGCRVAPAPRVVAPASVARPAAHESASIVEAPPPPPPPEPAPPLAWRHVFVAAPEAGSFAIVDARTTLRRVPRRDAAGWEFSWGARAVRVVGRRSGFIEVELDWPDDPTVAHCVLAPYATLGLRMFVREEELADVTTETVVLETGEGTGIVAAPGVLVHTFGEGEARRHQLYSAVGEQSRHSAWSGDSLSVTSAAPVVGIAKTYAPTRVDSLRAPLRTRVAFTDDEGESRARRIDYGGDEIRLVGEIYAQSRSDPDHVVVGSRCLQIAGHLSGTDTGSSGGVVCAGVPHPWDERWAIAAGTVLTWRAGGVAGKLYREVELAEAPRRRGGQQCFSPPLGCGRYDGLEVCVPARAVTRVPPTMERPLWSPKPP